MTEQLIYVNQESAEQNIQTQAESGSLAFALANTGIKSVSFETMFGGMFSVTTAADEESSYPWARSSVTGRLDKRYNYRITVDGATYILPSQLIDHDLGSSVLKVMEYLGNISLFKYSSDGLLNESFDDLPFLVVSDENDSGSIDVYTESAGEHTVLIERIIYDFEMIPPALIYGDMYVPMNVNHVSSTYALVSFGVNRFASSVKTAYAFGYGNVINSVQGSCAFGYLNTFSQQAVYAFGTGWRNTLTGQFTFATGTNNESSGNRSFVEGGNNWSQGAATHAEGTYNISSGNYGHAEGEGNRAFGLCSHVEGGGNVSDATQGYTHIGGVNNAISTESGKTVSITRYKADGTVRSTNNRTLGKYAEVIGNGDSDNQRSNARTLDWDGNETLYGNLTLGSGTGNPVTISNETFIPLEITCTANDDNGGTLGQTASQLKSAYTNGRQLELCLYGTKIKPNNITENANGLYVFTFMVYTQINGTNVLSIINTGATSADDNTYSVTLIPLS